MQLFSDIDSITSWEDAVKAPIVQVYIQLVGTASLADVQTLHIFTDGTLRTDADGQKHSAWSLAIIGDTRSGSTQFIGVVGDRLHVDGEVRGVG